MNEIDILVMQWNKLSDQIESINDSHWKVFTIIVAALGLSSLTNIVIGGLPVFIWMLPIVIMFVVFYESYRINELQRMVGYISKIEDSLNAIPSDTYRKAIKDKSSEGGFYGLEDPAQWFSRYYIHYSVRGNKTRTYIFIPVVGALIYIFTICAIILKKSWADLDFFIKIVYSTICLASLFVDLWALSYIKDAEKTKVTVRQNQLNIMDAEEDWNAELDSIYEEMPTSMKILSTFSKIALVFFSGMFIGDLYAHYRNYQQFYEAYNATNSAPWYYGVLPSFIHLVAVFIFWVIVNWFSGKRNGRI